METCKEKDEAGGDSAAKQAFVSRRSSSKPAKLSGRDVRIVAALVIYYIFRGLSGGVVSALTPVLLRRGISLTSLGTLQLSGWPLILTRPFLAAMCDSLYSDAFGRRKTWIVPSFVLLGALAISFANYAQHLYYNLNVYSNVVILAVVGIVFGLTEIVTNISFDAWAISLFSTEKVDWFATSQGVGLTFSQLFGSSIFVLYESYCVENIELLMKLYGAVLVIVAMAMWLFVTEARTQAATTPLTPTASVESGHQVKARGILAVFTNLFDVYNKLMHLTTMRYLFVLFISGSILSAPANLHEAKFVDLQLSVNTMAILNIPLTVLRSLLPFAIVRYTNTRPMIFFFKLIAVGYVLDLLFTLLFYVTPMFKRADGDDSSYPAYYYAIYTFARGVHFANDKAIGQCVGVFTAQITDVRIAATYMSLLNTMFSLCELLQSNIAFFFIEKTTIRQCVPKRNFTEDLSYYYGNNTCSSSIENEECKKHGGYCVATFDSFYLWTYVGCALGFVWMYVFRNVFKRLQNAPKADWTIGEQ